MPFDFNNVRAEHVDTDLAEEAKRLGIPAGNIAPPEGACRGLSYLGDSLQLVPEGQWKTEADAIQADGGGSTKLVTRVFNQANEGSCVGNAETQADQITQALQFGKDRVIQLSASSAYKQIGRSPNSGAMVPDAIEAHAETGILPLDTPENRSRFGNHVMPHTGFRVPFPDGWKDTAKFFRAHEWFVIRNVPELFTALLNRIPVVVGRAGHSIVYCDLIFKGNSANVVYCNSWSESWGFAAGDFKGGFGLDTMRLISSSARWCYGLRSVIVPEFQLPK